MSKPSTDEYETFTKTNSEFVQKFSTNLQESIIEDIESKKKLSDKEFERCWDYFYYLIEWILIDKVFWKL